MRIPGLLCNVVRVPLTSGAFSARARLADGAPDFCPEFVAGFGAPGDCYIENGDDSGSGSAKNGNRPQRLQELTADPGSATREDIDWIKALIERASEHEQPIENYHGILEAIAADHEDLELQEYAESATAGLHESRFELFKDKYRERSLEQAMADLDSFAEQERYHDIAVLCGYILITHGTMESMIRLFTHRQLLVKYCVMSQILEDEEAEHEFIQMMWENQLGYIQRDLKELPLLNGLKQRIVLAIVAQFHSRGINAAERLAMDALESIEDEELKDELMTEYILQSIFM